MYQGVDSVGVWFFQKNLQYKVEKTKKVVFTTKIIPNKENFDGNVQLLGLTVDKTFNWKTHTSISKAKLSCLFFIVRRFRIIIRYGVHLWDNSSYSIPIFRLYSEMLETLQGFIIRTIANHICWSRKCGHCLLCTFHQLVERHKVGIFSM